MGLPESPTREQLPIHVSTVDSERPLLSLHDVHESVVAEARIRQLGKNELSDLTREVHERNHRTTNQHGIDSLREAVIPARILELPPEEVAYYKRLDGVLGETFSGEHDESGSSRLERGFEEIIDIESIENADERAVARRSHIESLSQRLGARPEDAEAIYDQLAEHPEVYRALKQQRQVLLLIEHEPERYDEFIQLTRAGDDKAIDAFVSSIENDEVRENLQSLRSDESRVTQFIERRRVERLDLSRESFGNDVAGYDRLSTEQQLLLGRVVERSAPEFLALAREASLVGDDDGMTGTFLDRPLHIDHDGKAFLGTVEIQQLDARGICHAAAIDTARLRHFEVFNELTETKAAAILEPLLMLDRIESLPVEADLIRVTEILNAMGLKTAIPDGWMILREFRLLNDRGEPDQPGIQRLKNQLLELTRDSVNGFENLDTAQLRRILQFWDSTGSDPRQSIILSLSEAVALPESG